MRKFIIDIDAALGRAVALPIGRYERLFLHADALEVATGIDITAKAVITLNGETIHNLPLIDYVDINNIFRGMPTWNTTIGATDTCEAAIYTPENFIPKLIKLDLTQEGTARFTIKHPNPLWLLCEPRAVTDKVLVLKDDLLEENASADQLIRQTEMDHRIEAGTLTKFLVDLAPNKRISEVLSDNVELSIEHAASGNSSVTCFHCLFNKERMEISATKQAVEVIDKVEKAMVRHPDMASTIEAITGIRNLDVSRQRVLTTRRG